MKKICCSIFFLLVIKTTTILATCAIQFSGQVLDEHNKEALEFATIYIQEIQQGTIADQNGLFKFENLCANNYTIIIEHLGCTPDTIKLVINENVNKLFYLEHHAIELHEIIKTANNDNRNSTQQANSINENNITKLQGKDLTTILKQINGVRSLSTGSSINKPIINGVYGDRVSIVNNGVILASQDWGTEHAPEINPFAAQEITILKDALSLEYTTASIGGVVVIEPKTLTVKENNSTTINYVFQTNGLSNNLSAIYSNNIKQKFGYQLDASYKRNGDQKTPNYLLSNSGLQEFNIGLNTIWKIKSWNFKLNYSSFYQDLAILKASHIGNLTDLENALQTDRPLIVNPFSFKIDNPKQKINHHTIKIKTNKQLNNTSYIELSNSVQINKRQEFDIRRSGRSSTAALNMLLTTYDAGFNYNHSKVLKKNWYWKTTTGLQYQFKTNYNNPNTGIQPLIPDYYQNKIGVFNIHHFQKDKWIYDVGFRYEWNYFNAITFNNSNTLVENKYNFNNFGISLGNKIILDKITLSNNVSIASRNPNASELFSAGLHHGIATMEFGNSNLTTENSFKYSIGISIAPTKYINLNINNNISYIKNYIYLQPLNETILTVRGAFPAFTYTATNCLLYNLDANIKINFTDYLYLNTQYYLIRARDINNKDWIINIPSDQFKSTLSFEKDIKKMKSFYINVSGIYVLEQKRTPNSIVDYKAAPPAYFLLESNIGLTVPLKNTSQLQLNLSAENITNHSYRDYLNRFRYYTDEQGYNLTFRIHYKFN